MPRSAIVLILLVLIIIAAIVFLSIQADELPTRTIEADVASENSAQ
jgi:hypothetical protein